MLVSSVPNSNNNDNKSIADYAFEAIPTYRRVASIPDQINNGDGATALGMAALALINLPEDCRDVVGAAQQVHSQLKSIFTKEAEKYIPKYDYTKCQHPFSFFRGTLLHVLVDPNTSKNPKIAKKILKSDKTLAETKFGEKVLNALGVKNTDVIDTKIETIGSTKENPIFVKANIYEGTKFGELTARAMERTTKWGLVALALLEAPKIIKGFCNGDNITEKAGNGTKQTIKSAINVASITAGIGYLGALGMKKFGPTGSLVGMGLGAILGGTVSKKAQEFIS